MTWRLEFKLSAQVRALLFGRGCINLLRGTILKKKDLQLNAGYHTVYVRRTSFADGNILSRIRQSHPAVLVRVRDELETVMLRQTLQC